MLGQLANRTKAAIPLRWKQALLKLRPPAKPFVCPVCDSKLARFERLADYYLHELDRHQSIHSIFMAETANVLQYECRACHASDRDRLYALYIKQRYQPGKKLVEFAPMPALSRFINGLPLVEYRSADLQDPRADDKVDLTAIPYADASIDVFVASHILEHIPDDRKAMRELFRILRPGGWGIAMVPIQLDLEKTLEDLPIESPGDRWKYYGQNDHVRAYAKRDFVARLSETGFVVKQLGIDHFGAQTFERHGIHPRSVLYVVEKPGEAQIPR